MRAYLQANVGTGAGRWMRRTLLHYLIQEDKCLNEPAQYFLIKKQFLFAEAIEELADVVLERLAVDLVFLEKL